MTQYFVFIILAPLAAALSIGIAVYSWIRHNARGAKTLALYLTAVSLLLIFNTLDLISPTVGAKLFWARFEYILYALGPVAWITFALEYTARLKWLSWRRLWIFFLIPLITIALTLTNESHHLIWSSIQLISAGTFLNISAIPGLWGTTQIVYAYALMIIGAFLIASEYIHSHGIYRSQSMWVVIGAVSPLLVNFAYFLNLIPGLTKDFSPLALAFSGIAFAIGIFKHRLFDLMPIARTMLVDHMRDGMVVLDREGHIVDINPSFMKIMMLPEGRLIGQPVENILRFWKELPVSQNSEEWHCEVALMQTGTQVFFDLHSIRLMDLKNNFIGQLVTLHNVTERKQLLETVEKLATTDSLTGLYNRRYFMEMAEKEVERSLRYGHPVAILMIDLDKFKSVNDLHGHGVGDQVLLSFSHELLDSLRRMDLLARFGGEEFIILLPETNITDARGLAERLCSGTAQKSIITAVGEINITISIGVAGMVVENPISISALIEQADRALYDAKNKGRNRISVIEVRDYQYRFPQI